MMIKPRLPLENQLLSWIYTPINAIEANLGTNQSWMMFSPPSRLDSYVLARVTYDDGLMDFYDFNRPLGMNILEKYLYGEKYRKFVSEHLRTDRKSWMWEDGAKFAIRKLADKNKDKNPKKVELIRFWSLTPEWREHFIKHGESKPRYESFLFYTKGL